MQGLYTYIMYGCLSVNVSVFVNVSEFGYWSLRARTILYIYYVWLFMSVNVSVCQCK